MASQVGLRRLTWWGIGGKTAGAYSMFLLIVLAVVTLISDDHCALRWMKICPTVEDYFVTEE